MARCFDQELSDASFERERRAERDREKERRPRYPTTTRRQLELRARFADIMCGAVVEPDCDHLFEALSVNGINLDNYARKCILCGSDGRS